jgi:hypothetical protein
VSGANGVFGACARFIFNGRSARSERRLVRPPKWCGGATPAPPAQSPAEAKPTAEKESPETPSPTGGFARACCASESLSADHSGIIIVLSETDRNVCPTKANRGAWQLPDLLFLGRRGGANAVRPASTASAVFVLLLVRFWARWSHAPPLLISSDYACARRIASGNSLSVEDVVEALWITSEKLSSNFLSA